MVTLDPLALTADPRVYVPLDTGERALAAIAASLARGCAPVLLAGPPGIGKTLLLTVFAERARASYPCVRMSRSLCVEPDDLSHWLRQKLFGRSSTNRFEATAALVDDLRALRGGQVLLLVDEIHRTPEGCVRKLIELTQSIPELVVVMAADAGLDLDSILPLLPPASIVSLPASLPYAEIHRLYEAILAHPGLSPRLRRRLANLERSEIVRAAAGSPRTLKNDLVRRDLERREFVRLTPPVTQVEQSVAPARVAPFVAPKLPPKHAARALRQRPRSLSRRVVATRRATEAMLAGAYRESSRAAHAIVVACGAAVGVLLATLIGSARALIRVAVWLGRPFVLLARGTAFVLLRAPRAISAAVLGAAGAVVGALRASARAWVRVAVWFVRPFVLLARGMGLVLLRAPRAISAAVLGAAGAVFDALRASAHAWVRVAAWLGRPFVLLARGAAHLTPPPGATVAAARAAANAGRRAVADRCRAATAAFAALLRRVDGGAVLRRARAQWAGFSIGSFNAGPSPSERAKAFATRVRLEHGRVARMGSATLRSARTTAVPATALLAVALFSGIEHETGVPDAHAVSEFAVERSGVSPEVDALPEGHRRLTDVAGGGVAAPSVNVQVNAKPWARVRIDGVDVGPTPLSRRLAPGVYQFEAEFPDGRRVAREIDIHEERRFVALQ